LSGRGFEEKDVGEEIIGKGKVDGRITWAAHLRRRASLWNE
jgi:hypothetical protein